MQSPENWIDVLFESTLMYVVTSAGAFRYGKASLLFLLVEHGGASLDSL